MRAAQAKYKFLLLAKRQINVQGFVLHSGVIYVWGYCQQQRCIMWKSINLIIAMVSENPDRM